MATKTPVSSQPLKDAIKAFFEYTSDSSEISEMLRDILKASIGGDKVSGSNSLRKVSAMIWNVDRLTKFVRTLGIHLPTNSTDDETLAIIELHKEIDYEKFSDGINHGLAQWVFNEDIENLTLLWYVAETANIFQRVAELIEACERYDTLSS